VATYNSGGGHGVRISRIVFSAFLTVLWQRTKLKYMLYVDKMLLDV
jgi:hypothetical protein